MVKQKKFINSFNDIMNINHWRDEWHSLLLNSRTGIVSLGGIILLPILGKIIGTKSSLAVPLFLLAIILVVTLLATLWGYYIFDSKVSELNNNDLTNLNENVKDQKKDKENNSVIGTLKIVDHFENGGKDSAIVVCPFCHDDSWVGAILQKDPYPFTITALACCTFAFSFGHIFLNSAGFSDFISHLSDYIIPMFSEWFVLFCIGYIYRRWTYGSDPYSELRKEGLMILECCNCGNLYYIKEDDALNVNIKNISG